MVSETINNWNNQQYREAGVSASWAASWAGLYPPKTKEYEQDRDDRQPYAPAEFIAGRYYGLSGHDKRDKIHECFKADKELTDKLYDSMESYIGGDLESGDALMADTRKLFK